MQRTYRSHYKSLSKIYEERKISLKRGIFMKVVETHCKLIRNSSKTSTALTSRKKSRCDVIPEETQ